MAGPWTKYAAGPWVKYQGEDYGNETDAQTLVDTAGPDAPDAIPAGSPPPQIQSFKAGIEQSQAEAKRQTEKARRLGIAETALDIPGAFNLPALVSPEQMQKVGEFFNPLAPGALPQDEVTQGLLRGGAQVASGLTSPTVAAGALLAKIFPVPVSTYFAGQTLGAIPETTKSLLESKTPGEAAERAVPTAANLLFAKLLGKHLVESAPVESTKPAAIPETSKPAEEAPLSPEGYRVIGQGLFESDSPPPAEAENISTIKSKGKTTYTFRLPPKEVAAESPVTESVPEVKATEPQLESATPATDAAPEPQPTEAVSPAEEPPKAEAGSKVPAPEPVSIGASLGITPTSPLSVNLDTSRIATAIKGAAGHTLPKFTAKLREAGEAGARYLSSRIAAPFKSIMFSRRVLASGVNPKKFGTALTEDNLRSVREDFSNAANQAAAKGDIALATELGNKAANVRSLIGANNSPFKTEAEYQAFLKEPTTLAAIEIHKKLWEEEIEPQYRKAQGLDPDVALPTRGLQTEARINLKALLEDEPGNRVVTAGRGSLLTTFKKKSPFAREAKGTAQRYETDYNEIIGNTYAKQLEIANQNDFHRVLVENGLAKIGPKAPDEVAGEAPSQAFPLQRRLILSDGKSFAKNENLYLPKSLEKEYRAASNLNPKATALLLSHISNVLNKAAISSVSEFVGHTWNLSDALFNSPKANVVTDALLKATGRADVIPTIFKVLQKARADNAAQLAEIAEIGAMREPITALGVGGRAIKWYDKTVRLLLDDAYKGLAEKGLVDKTETARREFINQVGQYNTRAQGPIIRGLRETGIGPFATAGRAFSVLGVRRLLLDPAVAGAGPAASAMLKANVLGSIVGFFVLRGIINHFTVGNMNGRPGTKLMDVDLGTENKKGEPNVFPLGDLLGPGKGLRVTGARGAIEAGRMGLNKAEMADAAGRDALSSALSPAWGPPVRAVSTLLSSRQTVFGPKIARAAKPEENQLAINAGAALKAANPLLDATVDAAQGKQPELRKILGRLSPLPGRTAEKEAAMPRIVDRAKTNEYKDWLIREARKLPMEERVQFVIDHSKDAGFTGRDIGEIKSRIKY
jgi:hypothetical protein